MKYLMLAILLAYGISMTVIAFDWKARYEHVLDEWVDQDKKILHQETIIKRLRYLLYDGAIPLPEVNEDPFAAKPEEYSL